MEKPPEPSSADGRQATPQVAGFEGFRRIGTGSFSTVYRATQVQMGRPVAVKVLHTELATEEDQRALSRECRAMGVLSRHPNIVTVYSDAVTADGRACLVMELYDQNYRDILSAHGPLPLDELLLVGVKIAGALQAAHDTGVLHRDIKPHNIFVSEFGEPALGDFGISSFDDERAATVESGLSVAYAAPEVIEDVEATYLSDVYSLAASLHHLAEGSPPFAGPDLGDLARRIVSEQPPRLARDDVPESLRQLLRRGLAKSPEHRMDSAGDFAESLRDIRSELGLDAATVPLSRSERTGESGESESAVGAAVVDVPASVTLREDDVIEAALQRHRVSGQAARGHSPERRSPNAVDDAVRGRRWWSANHVAVDAAIAVVVVALVVYAVLGLA